MTESPTDLQCVVCKGRFACENVRNLYKISDTLATALRLEDNPPKVFSFCFDCWQQEIEKVYKDELIETLFASLWDTEGDLIAKELELGKKEDDLVEEQNNRDNFISNIRNLLEIQGYDKKPRDLDECFDCIDQQVDQETYNLITKISSDTGKSRPKVLAALVQTGYDEYLRLSNGNGHGKKKAKRDDNGRE
jgi:hypothetical protein